MWLNRQHINYNGKPGVYGGGAMCTCAKCINKRNLKNKQLSICVDCKKFIDCKFAEISSNIGNCSHFSDEDEGYEYPER